MVINVTQEDIYFGQRKECYKCPVALAINRSLPEMTAKVGHFDICLYDATRKPLRTVETPLSVWVFITKFDLGRRVEPFSFELEV